MEEATGWIGISRYETNRKASPYQSDMMDRERLLTASFILPAKTGGQRRTSDMREEVKPALCRFPSLRHVFADHGYAGDKLSDALALMGKWSSKIIKRPDTPKGLELLPR